MSIPYVTDGETDLDSALFNPWIDRMNTTASDHSGLAQQVANARAGIFNVLDYEAAGDGVTNDRGAIQDAIDACLNAGGGTVYFPGDRTYRIEITETGDVDHLTVDGDAPLTLIGGAGAKLDFYSYGGDPDTTWQIVSGVVKRGDGIRFEGGDAYADRRGPYRIIGLELDGNYTYTGDSTKPVPTDTGDGWDVSHKCLAFRAGDYFDWLEVRDCNLHNWAGEIIYSGGANDSATPIISNAEIVGNLIHDTNGDGISISAKRLLIERNEIHTCAGNGTECAPSGATHIICHNHVHDIGIDGVVEVHFGDDDSSSLVHHNRITNVTVGGIALYSACNSRVHDNIIIDCATGIRQEIGSGFPNDISRNVDVFANTILAHETNPSVGISCGFSTAQVLRHRVYDNRIGRTTDGETNSKIIGQPITIFPNTDLSQIRFRDNAYYGTHGDTTSGKCVDTLLTGTSQTTVASFKPSYEALLEVLVSVRVITGSTNVTITVTSEDYADVATSYPVLALTSLATGSYSYGAILVPTDSRATCAVKVTAGTANQVYATAQIREV